MADRRARLADQCVNRVFTQRLRRAQFATFAHDAEQRPFGNRTGREPGVKKTFHPMRHGHGPAPSSLPQKIQQHPALVTELQVTHLQADELVATQRADQ